MGLLASIVIPNLDSQLVDQTLAALQSQSLDPESLEILVVGRDAPGRVPRDGSVRFIESEQPLGAGAARNLGVQAADSQKILFTDADCRPAADWAEQLVAALDHSPVAGGSVRFSLTGNRWAVADNIASFHELLDDRPAGSDRHTARRQLESGSPTPGLGSSRPFRRGSDHQRGLRLDPQGSSPGPRGLLRARSRGRACRCSG